MHIICQAQNDENMTDEIEIALKSLQAPQFWKISLLPMETYLALNLCTYIFRASYTFCDGKFFSAKSVSSVLTRMWLQFLLAWFCRSVSSEFSMVSDWAVWDIFSTTVKTSYLSTPLLREGASRVLLWNGEKITLSCSGGLKFTLEGHEGNLVRVLAASWW